MNYGECLDFEKSDATTQVMVLQFVIFFARLAFNQLNFGFVFVI